MYVRHRARWGAHQGILIFKNNNRLLTFRVFVSKKVLSLYSRFIEQCIFKENPQIIISNVHNIVFYVGSGELPSWHMF